MGANVQTGCAEVKGQVRTWPLTGPLAEYDYRQQAEELLDGGILQAIDAGVVKGKRISRFDAACLTSMAAL